MKYFVIFIFTISSVSAQNMLNDTITIKSVDEITFEMLLAPGYAHLWNINGKRLIGFGTHLGFAYTGFPSQYGDFVLLKIFARNFFNSKYIGKDKYDFGVFSSISMPDGLLTYGVTLSYYLNFSKSIKIGVNSVIGHVNGTNEIIGFIGFFPVISYKFIKTK